jgi:hypothetical protein
MITIALLGVSQIVTIIISVLSLLMTVGLTLVFRKFRDEEKSRSAPVPITKDELDTLVKEIATRRVTELLEPIKEEIKFLGKFQ